MSTEENAVMKDVSGQGAASQITMSDLTSNKNHCDECAESGKTVCAAGFCQICTDLLCEPCMEQHKKTRSSRNHEILLVQDMPKVKPNTSDVEMCAIHIDRPVEAYCADHNTFGCSLCMMNDHRSCQNVGLLCDLSRGIESSNDFLDFQKAANTCKTLRDEYKQAIAIHFSINNECHAKTLEGFQQLRSMLLSMSEEMEETVHEEANKLKKENEGELNKLEERLEQNLNEVIPFMVKIDEMNDRKQPELIFMALKQYGRRIVDTVERLKAIHQDIIFKTFNFHFDTAIKQEIIKTSTVNAETAPFPYIKDPESLKDDCNNMGLTASSVSTIYIKAREDSYACWVNGMSQLSATELILTDEVNKCLKLVDTSSNTVIMRRDLTHRPYDITNAPECRLAVTFPSLKKIQYFTADRNLNHLDSIDASGECYSVHCTGDSLIVSYIRPVQLKILDMTGKVLQILQHDTSGEELFLQPYNLAVSHDNKTIYVSDYEKNTITCMDTSGVVHWVYKDQEMKAPRGVIVGECGRLYICSLNNDTIHVVSDDGVRLNVIPTSQSGVRSPSAVCYSSIDQTLYVSSTFGDPEHRNFIKRISKYI